MLKLISITIFSALLLSGCANRATSRVEPNVDLSKIKTIYVKKNATDTKGTNILIHEKLASLGLSVQGGTSEAPENVDAVLTYKDKWVWDITMYMVELDLVMREPSSNLPIAKANSLHTSLSRLSPKAMVEEVVTNLFRGTVQ